MKIQPQGAVALNAPMHPRPARAPQGESNAAALTETSDRFVRAAEILNDPQPLKPQSVGFLKTALESAKGVALDMMSALMGVVPEPVSDIEATEIAQKESAWYRETYGVVEDSGHGERLQNLTNLASSGHQSLNLKPTVLDTAEELGAYLPDGSILVSRGLMDSTTDDELLFVLGHEVGHGDRKHDAQRYAFEQESHKLNPSGGAPEGLRAKLLDRKMGEFFHQAEFEADQDGAHTLVSEGKGLRPAVSFFLRNPEEESVSHPSSADRIWHLAGDNPSA